VVELLQVLEGLAYVGFIAGAIFAVLELRSISKDRKLELLMRLMEKWNSREFTAAMVNWVQADFRSAEMAEKTCPKADLVMMAEYFDWAASLARNKLVSEGFVSGNLDFEFVWTRMKPWCLHWREQTAPGQLNSFEWMANEKRTERQATG